jgi:DNA-binding NarL/FixJ family response regulator
MLTTREIEVLRLLAKGCSYAAIGERLGISANTVGTHLKSSYRKLEVRCAAAAVMRAIELRLLDVDSGSGNGSGTSASRSSSEGTAWAA